MTPLRNALKEWAVICRALAAGRQTILLRKGGIAERSDSFEVEQQRFWLFPTYVHQQKDGILPQAIPLLELTEAERPPRDIVRLSHFAELIRSYHVNDLDTACRLEGLHCWSQETVKARFEYRRPGLHVLALRVYRSSQLFEMSDIADYAGCRSWVELQQDLPTEGAIPVVENAAFEEVLRKLDCLLAPSAQS